jgi:hypothetical protein
MKTFWPTFWATLAAILVAAAIIYGVTIKLLDWKLAKIKKEMGFSDGSSEKSHDDTPSQLVVPSSGTPTKSEDLAERIHRKLEEKLGHKHGILFMSPTPQPSTPQP